MFEKAALFLLAYLPLQIALSPSESIDLSSVRLFIVLLFIWWVFRSLLLKKILIPTNTISLFLYSFVFFSIFSIFFAENYHWAFRKLIFLLSILPVYFIYFNLFQNFDFKIKALKYVVYGALLAGMTGIIQFFSQFVFNIEKVYSFWAVNISPLFLGKAFSQAVLEHSSWLVNISGSTLMRAISVFPDPHMFSYYMGMTAAISFSLYLYNKELFFLNSFFILLFANIISFSRGAYLGIFLAFIFFVVYASKNKAPGLQKSLRLILLVSIVIMFVFLISPARNRFFSSFDLQDGSNSERLVLWGKSIRIIEDNPLGVGVGNYSLKILPSASYRDPIYAHNLYLDIFVETGIFGLISFICILLFSIIFFWKKSFKHILYLGPLFSIIIFSTHSFVETPLYSVHIFTLFLIILSTSSESYAKKIN